MDVFAKAILTMIAFVENKIAPDNVTKKPVSESFLSALFVIAIN